MEMKCDEGDQKISNMKVTQNSLKHNFILDFLKSDEILNIGKFFVIVHRQPTGRTDTIVTT